MSYPSSIDSFPTHTNGQVIDASYDNNQQTAIVSLETKLGVDSSAVVTSIDYLLKNTASIDPGHKHSVSSISATGTPSSGTFLRGDGSWTVPTFAAWIDIGHIGGIVPNSTYSDVEAYMAYDGSTTVFIESVGYPFQQRQLTTDWATATQVRGWLLLGAYYYVWVHDVSNNYRVYRFDKTNLAAGGTNMTISGQSFSTTGGGNMAMTTDGTSFYFNFKGGNSANAYVISKYSLSGTTLTYVTDITCGSTANSIINMMVDTNQNIYGVSSADSKLRKYNSSGALQYTNASGYSNVGGVYNFNSLAFYVCYSNAPSTGYAKIIV